jgi:uncharacterized protein (TIGR02646 family)
VIAIVRTPEPTVLRKYAVKWLANLEAVLADPTASSVQRKKAISRYKHPEVKSALVQLFHGKCAYCESKITAVTYGQIEHFYPKSLYPKQTFDWQNLLLSCDICNDKGHKGERFPLDDQGQPLLIDPTDGRSDISEHLRFLWDSVVGSAVVYGLDVRGRLVEEIFDLNGLRGRMELVRHRSQYIRRLIALCMFATDNNGEALVLLREACSPEAEYSAFARGVCKAVIGTLP